MTNLKPKVIVNGGFHKSGAIVEGDKGIEYEHTGFDTVYFGLDFKAHHIEFLKEVAVDEAGEVDELTEDDKLLALISGDNDDLKFDRQLKKCVVRKESLSGRAHVEDGSNGKYSFSIFGSEKEFTELSLQVERGNVDRLTIFGYKLFDEFERQDEEEFGIEMRLSDSRFDELHARLRNGCASTRLRVSLLGSSKFFAEWSPVNDAGRLIKYLENIDDLNNPEDKPKHFSARHQRSMEFSLHIRSPFNGSNEHDTDTDGEME